MADQMTAEGVEERRWVRVGRALLDAFAVSSRMVPPPAVTRHRPRQEALTRTTSDQ